jgi:hypothetical protein
MNKHVKLCLLHKVSFTSFQQEKWQCVLCYYFLACSLLLALRRPMHRLEDNIKMDHKEIRWEVVNWIHLAENGHQ